MNTKPRLYQRIAFNLIVAVVIGVCFGARQGVAQRLWQESGQTANPNPFPSFPVHAHLLPTGKVMFWSQKLQSMLDDTDPRSWDPANKSIIPPVTPGYDLFCAGHSFLADGRLFVAGGNVELNGITGFAKASIYNPLMNTWTGLPDMPGMPNVPGGYSGRWYPTVTVLANGDVLVVAGVIDLNFGDNPLPQVFQRERDERDVA